VPKSCRELFRQPANLHDLGYVIGGTSDHRKACDNALFRGCVAVAGFDIKALWWAFAAWRAVRWGGDLPVLHSWETRKAPLAYEEVYKLAKYRLENK
jgi:hypothetical protein